MFQPDEKTFKSADSSIPLVDCLLEENHLGHNVLNYRDEYVNKNLSSKVLVLFNGFSHSTIRDVSHLRGTMTTMIL